LVQQCINDGVFSANGVCHDPKPKKERNAKKSMYFLQFIGNDNMKQQILH